MIAAAKIEPIKTIQLHYYKNSIAFLQELTIRTLKTMIIAKSVIVTYYPHCYPLHNIYEFPFMVINSKHVISSQRVHSMLLSFLIKGQQQKRMQNVLINNCLIDILPIYKGCQQIIQISAMFSQLDLNDYYILFSPIMKFLQWRKLKHKHQKFIQQKLYTNHDGSLNNEYLFLKLNQLSQIFKYYRQQKINPTIYRWMKLHLEILFQIVFQINSVLLKTIRQHPLSEYLKDQQIQFENKQNITEIKQLLIIDLNEDQHMKEDQPKKQNNKDKEKQDKEKQNKQQQKQKVLSHLVKPLVTFTFFWCVYFAIK